MDVTSLAIPDVKLITPKRFNDDRGFFSEVYNREAFVSNGIGPVFVQDNHCLSHATHTVRALHFQKPPFAQAKLVRVTRGRILDVAVDLRHASPTYGRHVSVELSAENWAQLLVPAGFAHGYCTLEPNTEVLYKVDAPYAPKHDAGILWSDPALGIDWPAKADQAKLSDKDARLPLMRDIGAVF